MTPTELDEKLLSDVRNALEHEDSTRVNELLDEYEPADVAEMLSELDLDEQAEMLDDLPAEDAADVMEFLDRDEKVELAASLPLKLLAEVLDEMEPDEAADILLDLDKKQAVLALERMHPDLAELVRPLLVHDDDTAGGRMTSRFPVLRDWMTASQAIAYLRSLRPTSEDHYYLYVINRGRHLIGVVSLRDLIIALPRDTIGSLMDPDVIRVTTGTDQETCAQLISKYGLLALPVVDSDNHLVGVITHDDLVSIIEEEATKDLYGLANLSPDSDLGVFSPFKMMIQKRLPWLVINLFTAFLASSVVSAFEGTIAKVAALAAFQSIVAGMGGNAGTQTLTIIVRGLALGEMEFRDVWQVLLREFGLGVVHGLVTGLIVAGIAWLWKGIPILGLITGIAIVGNLVMAGLAGTLVPVMLKRLKLDPALASAVITTTVTDCCGFLFFLGLATLFLPYLQ
ncbi:MAG TPA: magnesium transporter [Anaerolineales bacterium]|nr:magnesium transporter [Anaerolineales bacterium]